MFSVSKNIYNTKPERLTTIKFFTATGKLKKFSDEYRRSMCSPRVTWHTAMMMCGKKARIIATVKNIDKPMLTRVWQELEYRIDVCRVTRGAPIEHL
jgi:hypothetical protein